MPAPLPTLPGVYYTYVWMLHNGLKCGSTFTFKTDAPAASIGEASANAQLIADSLANQWSTIMVPHYPNSVTGTNSRVYALQYPTLPAAFGFTAHTGSGGIDEAPPAVAAVLRHHVVRRGRGSQGHTAMSPLLLADLTPDRANVTAAFITNRTNDFQDFIGAVQADFLAGGAGGDLSFVQLSRKGDGATYAIASSVVEPLLGTERSRTLRP